MLHLMIAKQKKQKERAKELWNLRDDLKKEWTREEADEYAQLSTDMEKTQKDIEDRIKYQKYVSEDVKDKAEKKFERETSDVGIPNLIRHLLHQSSISGHSDFPKEDAGKIKEFVRENENIYGGNAPQNGISIPPDAFRNTQKEYKRAVLLSGNTAASTEYLEPMTLDVLYSKSIFGPDALGVKARQVGSYSSYKIVKLNDPTAQRSNFKAEGASLDTRDVTVTEELSLEPKRGGRIITVSDLFMKTSRDNSVLERNMLMEFGSWWSDQALNANNSANAERVSGLLRDAGLSTVDAGANGDAISWTKLITAIEKQELANVPTGLKRCFVCNPAVKTRAWDTLIKQASGSELIYQNGMMAGLKTVSTNHITKAGSKGSGRNLSDVLLTIPEFIVMPVWFLPTIQLNELAKEYWEKGLVGLKISAWQNIAFERSNLHVLIKDIKTTA